MLSLKSCLTYSASLLLLSAVAGPKVQAQSVDVPFNGTAPTACTFGAITNGVLAKYGTQSAIAGAAGVTGLASGTAGRVSVTCTAPGSLTVASPTTVSEPATFSPAVRQSIVQRGTNLNPADFTSANVGGNFDPTIPVPTAAMALPVGNSVLNVAMIAGTNVAGTIPSGSYSYTVRLTIAPN